VGVFLDLCKAFDVVSEDILLMKLVRMGIRDAALWWFKSYLKNRKLNSVNILIMQSIILGPILFLRFGTINTFICK
jgi:hypothetical protein